MGFWIFMAANSMLIPFLMIVAGYLFIKRPPRTINGIYGYRTSMSRKNQQTWDYAHYYCGKLWWKAGRILGAVTLLIVLPVMGKGEEVIGSVAGIWVCLQCGVMLITIVFVERALKRRFDRNGNLRS